MFALKGYDRSLAAFPSWKIVGSESDGQFNFFIDGLKLEDEGLFACEVSPFMDYPALKEVANLRVLVKPSRVQINDRPTDSSKIQPVSIRYDEPTYQVNCKVDGAKPAAQIKWLNESGHEFYGTSRTYQQGRLYSTISTLHLQPSLTLHKKKFTCDVRHETLTNGDKLRTAFEVEVTAPPSSPVISGYTSGQRLLNGTQLQLSCVARGGYPLSRVIWYRLLPSTNPEGGPIEEKLIDNSFNVNSDYTENNYTFIVTPQDNNSTLKCDVINSYLYTLGKQMNNRITMQVNFGPSEVFMHDNTPNSTTTIVDGTTRQFVCNSTTSNPRPLLLWKLDNQILTPDVPPKDEVGLYGGTRVQIVKTMGIDTRLKEHHGKQLICEGKNPETGHTVQDRTFLNIIYDANDIEIHGFQNNQIVKAGETVSIECLLRGGNPVGRVDWYKGERFLRSEYKTDAKYALAKIEFEALPSDDNVTLTCKGQVHDFKEKSASIKLRVFFLPLDVTILDNQRLNALTVGDKPEFTCKTTHSNPQSQLRVYRQGNDGRHYLDTTDEMNIKENGGFINSVKFQLPSVDITYHGNFLTCESSIDINGEIITKHASYVINVNHKPHFNDYDPFADVKENQSFNLTLEAIGYPMPVTYTWYHPSGRALVTGQAYTVQQGHLSIRSITKTDLGVYRCQATNTIGTTETNFTLNVLYAPVVTKTIGFSSFDAVTPGATVTLKCQIEANPINLSNIRWFKNSVPIIQNGIRFERQFVLNEASLIIRSVRKEDAGQYTCEIENPFGQNQANVPLVVKYPPEITRDPKYSKAATDSDRFLTAELHCGISALPKPTVQWYKVKDSVILTVANMEYANIFSLQGPDELPLISKYRTVINDLPSTSTPQTLFTYDSVLFIANVTKEDHGTYRCKADNQLGTDIAYVQLTGLTRPDTPTDLQARNVTHNSILLQWQPGFDGGAPQQFQIRYRLQANDRYHYEDIPPRATAVAVKNLEIGTTYLFAVRSNNSYHLSPWTDEFSITTSRDVPQSIYPFIPQTRFSLTVILVVCALGILLLLFNIILIAIFVKRRRKKSDNDSTTGTNETEANTVEIFQPPPIFTDDNSGYPFNTYQRYDEEDVKRPFVTHATTGTKTLRLSPQNQNSGEKRILQPQSPLWRNN
ncbi:unnamed protein product, partial [Didymodactylos carnosus]